MIWAAPIGRRPVAFLVPARSSPRPSGTRCPARRRRSSASCCRASGSAAARAGASTPSTSSLPDTITLIAQRAPGRVVVPPGDRAGRARGAAADLHRVRAGHPRGQPRPAVRAGAGEHGPARAVGRPRADGHRHLHPAPVGGNLAEILDSIAFTIRERVRIKGEIRTLTAQQRLSGYVVGFLPIALAGFLFVAAPTSWSRCSPTRPSVLGLPAGVDHPGLRRLHDVHRLHAHPPDRRHRGLTRCPSSSPVAAVAAGRSCSSSSGSPAARRSTPSRRA